MQAAEQQVASAQANLDSVAAGADPEQISAARQQMASGQAQVARLNGAPRQSELDAAQASVAAANATLDRVKAGRTETELSVARAQIESRKADLELATIQLAETELKAPFDGVIAQLKLKQREYITPGTPVVQLADTATWQIETADLTELNIVKVKSGRSGQHHLRRAARLRAARHGQADRRLRREPAGRYRLHRHRAARPARPAPEMEHDRFGQHRRQIRHPIDKRFSLYNRFGDGVWARPNPIPERKVTINLTASGHLAQAF